MRRPSAEHGISMWSFERQRESDIYLIVEPAPLVQEFKERRVSLASPEIKVTDLEIAPDCTTSQYPAELCSVMIWKRTVAVVVSLSVVI